MPHLSPERSLSPSPGRIARLSKAQFGFALVLVSLTMVFGATLIAYLITRAQNQVWRTPQMPDLPVGLWVSTVCLLALSAFAETGRRALAQNRLQTLKSCLAATGACASLYLITQVLNWRTLAVNFTQEPRTLYAFTFYFLTGLHALHVLAGLIPLAIVIRKAARAEYTSSHSEGVQLCVQYWHFLGVVWLVLFLALRLGT